VNRYTSIGFIITRQAIKDNLYQSSFPLQAKALRQSMEQTKEALGRFGPQQRLLVELPDWRRSAAVLDAAPN